MRKGVKSCDFHSPNPCSSWCYDTDYLVQMIQSPNMYDAMSIYVCTDVLEFFCNHILPYMQHTFYLVSGDSDARVPNGHIDIWHNMRILEEEVCLKILNHPKLIKWFAQNCIYTNENIVNSTNEKVFSHFSETKICQLPIGLDYHTISNDPGKFWRDANEGYSTKYQESILKNIRNTIIPFHERIQKIYVNATMGTARQIDLDQIPSDLIYLNTEMMPRSKVWTKMTNYSFVFSPYGNGPDCHRHWEVLSVGCIPIIKTFGSDKMFEDLPVLIVKEWSDVNQELLESTIESFKKTTFNYDKLLLKYWVDLFSCPPDFQK